MMKLFGLRITPFFIFILGLECLALLISIYIGVLLYNGTSFITISDDLLNQALYSGIVLLILLTILTPSFLYQTKVINHVKKAINDKAFVFIIAFTSMAIILFTSNVELNSETIFITALLSAFIGLVFNQIRLFSKYWRFLIRSGVN